MPTKKNMIELSVICKSKHWPVRLKKVNFILSKIMNFSKDLNFKENIDYNCNFILSDNKLVKKMNYKFCNKKKTTDVLTFVSEVCLKKYTKTKICDIFLSAEVIKKDAIINKISFYDHLTHLLIHSLLHLNGYTHKEFNNFNKMKNIEVKILKNLGISNPYLYN